MPNHIAVIMDGNGRWAKNKLLPRLVGHNKGLDSVKKIIECSIKYKIKTSRYMHLVRKTGKDL